MASDSHPHLTRLANSVLQPGFAGTTAPDWVRRRIADGLASLHPAVAAGERALGAGRQVALEEVRAAALEAGERQPPPVRRRVTSPAPRTLPPDASTTAVVSRSSA